MKFNIFIFHEQDVLDFRDVVEIKRKNRIGVETEREMEEKLKRLKTRKGTSLRPVLVYDGELDPQLSGRGFFAATVDAARLLGK